MLRGLRPLVVLIVTLSFGIGSAFAVELTILHTNDTHGHLMPFSYPASAEPGSAAGDLAVKTNIGGIARRATLVQTIRSELKARGAAVWLIDAGDFSDGGAGRRAVRGATLRSR